MDDLIYRHDATKALNCKIRISGDENAEIVATTLKSFIRKIHEIPAVDVRENRRGQWLHVLDTEEGEFWECSECGARWVFTEGSTPYSEEAYYCMNCGADMREDQNG